MKYQLISTHALTWSATIPNLKMKLQSRISTHALTWSATASVESSVASVSISTHALTWSATYLGLDGKLHCADFNSRTHVECDPFCPPFF